MSVVMTRIPAGEPKKSGDFEILDAANEAQDGRTGQRGQHKLQRDRAKSSQA